MNIFHLPIISTTEIDEVKKIFVDEILSHKLIFEGINLVIFPDDFEHICYEYAPGGLYKGKFSLRRARKMLAIRELCNGSIPYILIYQNTRVDKSVCVLAESIEFAMYIKPQTSPKGTFLRLGTIVAYGEKVESKIEKQKKSGIIISNIQEVVKIGS